MPSNLEEPVSTTSIIGPLKARVFAAAVVTIILGAIGSGVWEMVARPGITTLGRATLKMLSLTSTAVRDAPYESAALDPAPIIPAIFLMLLSSLPLYAIVALIFWLFNSSILKDAKKNAAAVTTSEGTTAEETKDYIERLTLSIKNTRRHIWTTTTLLIVTLSITFIYGLGSSAIISQATEVRRRFMANMMILGPSISDAEEEALRSEFASMRSHADFLRLQEKMDLFSTQRKVLLHRMD